jgi:antitoxin YefM
VKPTIILDEDSSADAETAHLLRSPRNAARLLAALERSKAGTVEPKTVEELRRELGLDAKE